MQLNVPESVPARVVTFLLNRGLDVESPFVTSDGCDTVNAMWFAVARGRNRTLVKLLIKRGGTPNGFPAQRSGVNGSCYFFLSLLNQFNKSLPWTPLLKAKCFQRKSSRPAT